MKVVTDHSDLTKLTNGKGLPSRTDRWCLKLSLKGVDIEHRASKENAIADTLSRDCDPQKERFREG